MYCTYTVFTVHCTLCSGHFYLTSTVYKKKLIVVLYSKAVLRSWSRGLFRPVLDSKFPNFVFLSFEANYELVGAGTGADKKGPIPQQRYSFRQFHSRDFFSIQNKSKFPNFIIPLWPSRSAIAVLFV